jgi:glycosyltransferase involved in cell wall biosynthesis
MPDLVLTTHLNFTVAAYRLKQLVGIPYWTIAHGFEAWEIDRPQVLQALSHADRILAVSTYTRDRLLQNGGIDPQRVQILPNTFDADRFRVAQKPDYLLQRYGLSPDQPVILTVNRLAAGESFHSYDQVLHALPSIQKVIPHVHYLIVGKGDDRDRLEQLIQSKQLQSCVTLAGFVSDAELPNYYNLCDAFAMPSKLEGFGIVYLEAMASGKPVVGGLDGAIDALDRGRLGAAIDPDDVPLLAETLVQILQKQYPNPLLYQPQALREATVQTYGFPAFQHRLNNLMQSSPMGQNSRQLRPFSRFHKVVE